MLSAHRWYCQGAHTEKLYKKRSDKWKRRPRPMTRRSGQQISEGGGKPHQAGHTAAGMNSANIKQPGSHSILNRNRDTWRMERPDQDRIESVEKQLVPDRNGNQYADCRNQGEASPISE